MIDDDLQLDFDPGEDPVEWVLETMVQNWPGPEFPNAIERFDHRDSQSIDTGVRSADFDLADGISLGANHADSTEEPLGLEYSFSAETIVSVRLEGLHEDQYGHVTSGSAFRLLKEALKEALKRERKHPSINGGETDYHTLYIENEQSEDDDHRDYYWAQWDVRFDGREQRHD